MWHELQFFCSLLFFFFIFLNEPFGMVILIYDILLFFGPQFTCRISSFLDNNVRLSKKKRKSNYSQNIKKGKLFSKYFACFVLLSNLIVVVSMETRTQSFVMSKLIDIWHTFHIHYTSESSRIIIISTHSEMNLIWLSAKIMSAYHQWNAELLYIKLQFNPSNCQVKTKIQPSNDKECLNFPHWKTHTVRGWVHKCFQKPS